MSNLTNYNYETLERPYTNNLGRQSSFGVFENTQNIISENKPRTSINSDNVITEKNLSNIYVRNWVRSKNYIPKIRGFQIDGIKGTAEFRHLYSSSATVEGTITAGQLLVGGVTAVTVQPGDNLQIALNQINLVGGGVLRLSPGTYTQTTDLFVYDNTIIQGDSSANTVIDFAGTSSSIIYIGTDVYNTSTIASTSGTTVTGTSPGVTWDATMVGQYLFMDERFYRIVAFVSSSSLVIESAYADGASYSGAYRIVNPVNNIYINNVTLKNSTDTAVKGNDILDFGMEDVLFLNNNKGMVITDFSRIITEQVSFISQIDNGYELTNGSFFNAYSTVAAGNAGHGMELNNIKSCAWIISACDSNGEDGVNAVDITNCLFKLECASNTESGIELVSGCNFNFINDSLISGNGTTGIKLTATCDNNTIGSSVNVTNHSGVGDIGIHIANANCDNNYILAPMYSNNTTNITNSGTGTLFVTPV